MCPLYFLQNITGFVVGKDYETDGQIKKGAQFLNSVSNSTVPHLTVILGNSYGAGTYAMSGRAFDNRFTFIWPTAKIAVMGPQQIAGVMSIVRRARAERMGEKIDEKNEAQMVAFAEAAQEEGSLALRATGAISDDGIIDPRDTRTVLGLCLSVVNGKTIEGNTWVWSIQTMTFHKLLIANRGEIACRIIKSAHDMGISCVAVYVDADADSLFVKQADEAIRLTDSYLNSKEIIAAAKATGAQAIHPGYGFLSENAKFSRDVIKEGLIWVGPNSKVITSMGDKLKAKVLAEKAGVPTLPMTTDPKKASSIGYPILIKAAAGGGGKGMRIVDSNKELKESILGAQREALSGFGDDRVFIERYVASSRHIEIQILGDSYGNVVHLGERECSIQRRHQKIIEESPSPRVDPEMREAMGKAAVNLAKKLKYESAGTVEFLVDDKTGEFWFLEVNTRLQVEHPVTEGVTGKDLVYEQLRIARGEELGYTQEEIEWSGSSIEARLYAEDPSNDFLPATGKLIAYEPDSNIEARWDTGVEQGSIIRNRL